MTTNSPRSGRRAGMLGVLARRDFTLLWTAGLISSLGSWATFVAIPVFVFQQTGSALAATAVFTVTVIPMLFTSVAGIFVDRWDRRRVLIIANIAMAAVTAPLILMPDGQLWIVYASMFGLALAGNFSSPAENALLPTLAGRDQLPFANALNALNDNIGRIAGPALGAAILALGGFTTVIIFDVATFITAAALCTAIRTRSDSGALASDESPLGPPSPTPPVRQLIANIRRTVTDDGKAGLRTVRDTPTLVPILTAMGIVTVGDAIFSSLLGPYFGGPLAGSGATLGLWLSLRGVGGLLGSVPAGHLSRWMRPHYIVVISLTGAACLLALMAAAPQPLVAMVAAIGLGIFVVGWISNQQLLIQQNTPDTFLGRVFGIQRTISAAGMIIGSIAAGALADTLGIHNMLYLAAAGYFAAGIWLLTHYRSPG